MNALDEQVGGTHYKNNAIQPLQYVMANAMGFCEANIIKYITRYKHKGGVQDLEKVRHYVQLHQETVSTEPEVFKELRILFQTRSLLPISPWDYCEANAIEDERVRSIIVMVSYWRSEHYHGDGPVKVVLSAVDELITEQRELELQDHDREQTQDRR